jgi:tetratricopeptide (TPR) repeat protein
VTRSALLVACAALAAAAPARAQSRQSVDALESWINAVNAHQPGHLDRPAQFVGTLKYSDRAILNPAMTTFFVAVRGEPMSTKSDEQKRIVQLYLFVRGKPGLAAFVERAAVLHADAAIFRDKLPDFVDDAPAPGTTSSIDPRTGQPIVKRNGPPPPLLANDIAMVHTDGRVVGQDSLNWNWTFARSLLDLLMKEPGKDHARRGHSDIATDSDVVFVAEWYHATSAYLLALGRHADLTRHLGHAAVALPDDPHVLFDRACYAETLGLPLYQVLPGDSGYWNAATHIGIDVPPEDKTDEDAEKLFRQALTIDPAYAEARVRLARLLERRGLYDEAAAQIEQALAAKPGDAVAYFAHIVAGRIALARGHAADALGQYRAALAIFPDAQSALLGASQAAVMNSDVTEALALVQKLGDRTAAFMADPWWNYDLGAGRDVDELMAALWARVPR